MFASSRVHSKYTSKTNAFNVTTAKKKKLYIFPFQKLSITPHTKLRFAWKLLACRRFSFCPRPELTYLLLVLLCICENGLWAFCDDDAFRHNAADKKLIESHHGISFYSAVNKWRRWWRRWRRRRKKIERQTSNSKTDYYISYTIAID